MPHERRHRGLLRARRNLSLLSLIPPPSLSHTHTQTLFKLLLSHPLTHTHTHTQTNTHTQFILYFDRLTRDTHKKTDTDLAFREHASVQMDTHRLTAPLRDALTDVAAKVNVFKGMFSFSLSLSLSLGTLVGKETICCIFT